jgi:hypothetical protein
MTETTNTTLLTREQAITNLIGSVSLEEEALADILQAESAKLNAVINNEKTSTDEILCVNKSVQSMTNAITRLEIVLQTKLELVSCEICPICNAGDTDNGDEDDNSDENTKG